MTKTLSLARDGTHPLVCDVSNARELFQITLMRGSNDRQRKFSEQAVLSILDVNSSPETRRRQENIPPI
jgi:hypothetical protein